MGFWNSIVSTVSDAASVVADTASSVASSVSETASKAATTVADTASSAFDAVSHYSSSAYDSICDFTTLKIKGMLRDLDLQTTINEIKKHQEENGGDYSALVNFISKLKDFSEDGVK